MNRIKERNSKVRQLLKEKLGKDVYTKTTKVWKRKLRILKGLYKGKKGIILTCGPSLNKYQKYIQWFVDNDFIVICVKQAILKMPEGMCDVHVGNFCNEGKYIYNKHSGPVSVFCQKNVSKKKTQLGKGGKNDYDIYVSHYSHNDYDNILTGIEKDTDEMSCEMWSKRQRFAVKWGDTMHELAIPMCINLGLKQVYVIGWDCNNFVKHFYGKSKENEATQGPLRKKLNKQHIQSSKKLYSFLKKHFGMELKLVGYDSALKIPRISIEDIKKQIITQSRTLNRF